MNSVNPINPVNPDSDNKVLHPGFRATKY